MQDARRVDQLLEGHRSRLINEVDTTVDPDRALGKEELLTRARSSSSAGSACAGPASWRLHDEQRFADDTAGPILMIGLPDPAPCQARALVKRH